MGELHEELSQPDKLISASSCVFLIILKGNYAEWGTTNQSDPLLCSGTRKNKTSLSSSRRFQQRVFTVANLFSSTKFLMHQFNGLLWSLWCSDVLGKLSLFWRRQTTSRTKIKGKSNKFISGWRMNEQLSVVFSLLFASSRWSSRIFLPNLALSMQITTEPHTDTRHWQFEKENIHICVAMSSNIQEKPVNQSISDFLQKLTRSFSRDTLTTTTTTTTTLSALSVS